MNLQEAVRKAEEMQEKGLLGNRVHSLMGLLMQASVGDCKSNQAPKSSTMDIPEADSKINDSVLNWMAWKNRQGMSRENARVAYIEQVYRLEEEIKLKYDSYKYLNRHEPNYYYHENNDFNSLNTNLHGLEETNVDSNASTVDSDLLTRTFLEDGSVLSGILYKRRDYIKSGWRPRNFSLQNKFLTYFMPDDNFTPRNTLFIEDCTLKQMEPIQAKLEDNEFHTLYPFSISHSLSKTVYYLASTSLQDTAVWLRALEFSMKGNEVSNSPLDSNTNHDPSTSVDSSRPPRKSSSNSQSDLNIGAQQRYLWRRSESNISLNNAIKVSSSDLKTNNSKDNVNEVQSTIDLPTNQMNHLAYYAPDGFEQTINRALSALLENTDSVDSPLLSLESNQGSESPDSQNELSSSWGDVFYNNADVVGLRKPHTLLESGSLVSIRADTVMNIDPITFMLAVINVECKASYDSNIEMGRRIKLYNSHTFLDYYRYKGLWPEPSRDVYCLVHWRLLEDGTCIVLMYSDKVANEGYSAEEIAVTRGDLILSGYRISPISIDGKIIDPNQCKVSYLWQMDMKSNVKPSIKSVVAERQVSLLQGIRRYIFESKQGEEHLAINLDVEKANNSKSNSNGKTDNLNVMHRKNRWLHFNEYKMLQHSLQLPCFDNSTIERLVDKTNIHIMTLDGLNNWNEIMKTRVKDKGNNNKGEQTGSNLRVGNGLIIQSISNEVSRRLSNSTNKTSISGGEISNEVTYSNHKQVSIQEIQKALPPSISHRIENSLMEMDDFRKEKEKASFGLSNPKNDASSTNQTISWELYQSTSILSEKEKSDGGKLDGPTETSSSSQKTSETNMETSHKEEKDGISQPQSTEQSTSVPKLYLRKPEDDTDMSSVTFLLEGCLPAPPLAVLHALQPDFKSLYNSSIEYSNIEKVYGVHTFITYDRVKQEYPMPPRDLCQLVHWRVMGDDTDTLEGKTSEGVDTLSAKTRRIVVIAIPDETQEMEEGITRVSVSECFYLTPIKSSISIDGIGTHFTHISKVNNKTVLPPQAKLNIIDRELSTYYQLGRFLQEFLKCRSIEDRKLYNLGTAIDGNLTENSEDREKEDDNPILMSNALIQPLMVQWNNWSANLIPDRVQSTQPEPEDKSKITVKDSIETTNDNNDEKMMTQSKDNSVDQLGSPYSSQVKGGNFYFGRSHSMENIALSLGASNENYNDYLSSPSESSESFVLKSPLSAVSSNSTKDSNAAADTTSLSNFFSLRRGSAGLSTLNPDYNSANCTVKSLTKLNVELDPTSFEERVQQVEVLKNNRGKETETLAKKRQSMRKSMRKSLRFVEADEYLGEEKNLKPKNTRKSLRFAEVKDNITKTTYGGLFQTIDHDKSSNQNEFLNNNQKMKTDFLSQEEYNDDTRKSLKSLLPKGNDDLDLNKPKDRVKAKIRSIFNLEKLIDIGSPLLNKNIGAYVILLAPTLLYYMSFNSPYRGLIFALSVLVSIRFMLYFPSSIRSLASMRAGTEWGQENIKSRVHIKFPIEITRLFKYMNEKKKIGTDKLALPHIALKAVAVALKEVPQLNGHTIMGNFFPCKSSDVSCDIKLRNGTYSLIKVAGAEKLSIHEIYEKMYEQQAAISQDMDPWFHRRKLILKYMPHSISKIMDTFFSYLGSGLGISIQALGIRAFPQGVCIVMTSPPFETHHTSQEHEFSVEPDVNSGDYIAPIILNIGQYYKKVQAVKSEMMPIPNLNITMSVRMQHCSLHHIQKFAVLVEKYMTDPRRLDLKDKKSEELAKYNKELAESDGKIENDLPQGHKNTSDEDDSESEPEKPTKSKKALKLLGETNITTGRP